MYSPDNEFSLDLFTDYRKVESETKYIVVDASGWVANFNTKIITITKPIQFTTLYAGLCNTMDDIDFMDIEMPIVAITQEFFEVVDGWIFKDDDSRGNIKNARWKENGIDMWT